VHQLFVTKVRTPVKVQIFLRRTLVKKRKKIIGYSSYIICSQKQQSNIYLAVLDLSNDI